MESLESLPKLPRASTTGHLGGNSRASGVDTLRKDEDDFASRPSMGPPVAPSSGMPSIPAIVSHMQRRGSGLPDGRAAASTPLYLAVRVRTLNLDVASGNIEVGLRLFGFWKSGLNYPEGTVLRQKHGEITPDLELEIPDIQLAGKVIRADDAEADREIKFHHVPEIDTDTMVTVFQYRAMIEIFRLEEFPFDEQSIELIINLPKSNAKDGHFCLLASDELHIEKERIRPRTTLARGDEDGHGCLEMTYNVQNLLLQQWSILSSELVPSRSDRLVLSLRLRRKHEYYVQRMLLPSAVCASLSMTAWNVEHHNFGERAAILVTLFLALVASTTSYSANLPKLPYLTLLDKYLSTCMAMTTLVTIGCVLGTPRGAEADEHKQVGGGESSDDFSAAVDRVAMVVITAWWLGYNAWFFGSNVFAQEIRRRASNFVEQHESTAARSNESFKSLPSLPPKS